MEIKKILLAGALVVSVASFSQKDELKALKKIYNKEEIKGADLTEYKSLVEKVQPLATEEGDKVYANFYKCMIPVLEFSAIDKTMPPLQIQLAFMKFVSPKAITELATGLNVTLDYEKKTGKKIQTEDINETISSFKPELLNFAIKLGEEKKYKESGDVLYAIYLLDKKDQETLYYAANYEANGNDYDKALEYYKELRALNYTGEGTLYFAKNKATGVEDSYSNKKMRDNLIELGSHNSPREEKLPSKKREIIKNISIILLEKGKLEEAKTAIEEARKENPDDADLMITEANIYLKLNDNVNYKRLISEAIEKRPNDEVLVFNLGVTCANAKQYDEAEKYYNRAIELKPDFLSAYINLADLILKPDSKLVDEMNKLTISPKDLKRNDVLKAERKKIFLKAMPLY
jgi:tetratricopeptide (TPR) repeat protein